MPQKAPKVDTRNFNDLQEESHKLIDRYVPQWTTRESSDLGMTMLMAFNRMQESIMHRLNRVPDKHYITFLNFIGEKRNIAAPSVASLTFSCYLEEPVELHRQAKVSTRQKREGGAKSFLTVTPLTVHPCKLMNFITVQGGDTPMSRQQMVYEEEPAIYSLRENALVSQRRISNISPNSQEGVRFFDMDPLNDGPNGYTSSQNIYVGHPSFAQGERGGHITITNSKGDSLVPFFDWFVMNSGDFQPVEVIEVEDDVGKNVPVLKVDWEKLDPMSIPIQRRFLSKELPDGVRRELQGTHPYIVGAIQYDRWLTQCFRDDLVLFWSDDRGGDEQEIFDWNVFQEGNEISFALEDLPPISTGWSVRFQFVDRRLPAGHKRYLPIYEWYYQTIDGWERIDSSQVRVDKSRVVLVGPFPQMVMTGQQFKAIRREAVAIDRICPDLDVQVTWERPIEHFLYQSEDSERITRLENDQVSWHPFQYSSTFPPTIGSSMLISSDLLLNDHQEAVTLDITYGFTLNGDPFTENPDLYALRLLYRAKDSWRVVWHPDQLYSRFTFHELRDQEDIEQEKEEDAEQQSMLSGLANMGSEETPKPVQKKYTIRIELDPRDNLEGIERHELESVTSGWLRFELIKANLMGEDEEKQKHPIQLTVYNVEIRKKSSPRDRFFEDKLLSPRCAQLTERPLNARFTKMQYRYQGQVYDYFPNLRCIDLTEQKSFVYLNFDKPLPIGARHSIYVRCQGEQFFADRIMWEVLEEGQGGTLYWRRLSNQNHFSFQRSGFLQFSIQEELKGTYEGFWIRGSFPSLAPTLPNVSHILLNTVEGVNLHQHRTERFSGMGTVNQEIHLLHKPTFSTLSIQDHREFVDKWDGIRLFVKENSTDNIEMIGFGEEEGEWIEWREISEQDMKYAGKNERVFWMDNVDGALHFGNGIHGMILPYGSNNVLVDLYYEVPGKHGNVGKSEIVVCDAHSSLQVTNFFPAIGGRDSETTAELLARDPILLTTRDRAVTRRDFESLALQASEEVARVKCGITEGHIEVIVLPRSALLGLGASEAQRKGSEPDLSMALGLRDHVSDFLRQRSLISLNFAVRLVRILSIDIHLELRVKSGANIEELQAETTQWLRSFLDPFEGGFQGDGWEFGATLFEEDLHRVSVQHPDIRNLERANFYPVRFGMTWPGWEEGMGLSQVQLNEHDLLWTRYVKISYTEV